MVAFATSLSKSYEQSRYSAPDHILRSELIYGEGFQSPGGIEAFKTTLLHKMPISPGMKILDIGSGLGGAAFLVTSSLDVEVVGIDPSNVMISIANDRKPEIDPHNRVSFIQGDVFSCELREASFDLIYSNDALLYERDKEKLSRRCWALLKPGGRICISDFCRGNSSPEFEHYIEVSGYHLSHISEYTAFLSAAGFVPLASEDTSRQTQGYLERDLDRYRRKIKAGEIFVSWEDADHIIERWQRKINFLKEKFLVQVLCVAQKPSSN